ncbi:MAG: 3-dehydroquinate synthase [Clostridium sp.]|nr:3-dehydroquinate synthase [Clostridium sp.]
MVYESSFERLGEELALAGLQDRRVMVLTDMTVNKLYGEDVMKVIRTHAKKVARTVILPGEKNKTLETVQVIYRNLLQEGFDRNDVLLALGGGVVGDLGGYVAATYMRGIHFVQVPTTLLAQTDSSIGGKTAVDFDGYKNIVGAFKMPKLVYHNLGVLSSLDERQYYNGFAEVMKIALIRDEAFYVWLIDKMDEIRDKHPQTLLKMVKLSCRNKQEVVEKDPYEQGERMILNFGHTIGHAIEKAKKFDLLHGECVALGCVAAAFLSYKRKLLRMEEYYEVRDMFVPFYLPITTEWIDPQEILRIIRADKKKDGDAVRFVLLQKIGRAKIVQDVTNEEILKALNEIMFKQGEE